MPDYIYSAEPGLLVGFHGCDEAVCKAIIGGRKQLKMSNNSWDWLGDGMYFWQNNYQRAWDYANNPSGTSKIKKPAVLGAVFSLGHCLDLTDKQSLDLVKIAYDFYATSIRSQGKKMPLNSNPIEAPNSKDNIIRRLDCAVIKTVHNLIHQENLQPFDSVRALLPEGDELYDGAGFLDKTHIQIAIRNPNMIKGFFLPRKVVQWKGLPIPIKPRPRPPGQKK